MSAFKTEEVEKDGHLYAVEWFYDQTAEAPWKFSDCHGVVIETRRKKHPHELKLSDNHLYDLRATLEIAKRDGWGCEEQGLTKAQAAELAVRKDFEYLKGWCDGSWHYIGITVARWDAVSTDQIQQQKNRAELWGIESDSEDYHKQVIDELIREIEEYLV